MATYIAYPNSELGRSASGIRGAIVNASDEEDARARANSMRATGNDPDFSERGAWTFEQINSTDSGAEALIEGAVLRAGAVARRGG